MDLWRPFNINQEDEVINIADNNEPENDIIITDDEMSDRENTEARRICVHLPIIAKQIVLNVYYYLKTRRKKST